MTEAGGDERIRVGAISAWDVCRDVDSKENDEAIVSMVVGDSSSCVCDIVADGVSVGKIRDWISDSAALIVASTLGLVTSSLVVISSLAAVETSLNIEAGYIVVVSTCEKAISHGNKEVLDTVFVEGKKGAIRVSCRMEDTIESMSLKRRDLSGLSRRDVALGVGAGVVRTSRKSSGSVVEIPP